MSEETTSEQLQKYLDQLRAGDKSCQDVLWNLVNDRLTKLTRRMKRHDFPDHPESTEDISQGAKLRLLKALHEIVPATPRDFYGFANLEIRRELLDTIRRFKGRNGKRKRTVSIDAGVEPDSDTYDPVPLSIWEELHEFIKTLPGLDREIAELMIYQEFTQKRAAEVIGISKDKFTDRWQKVIRPQITKLLPKELHPRR